MLKEFIPEDKISQLKYSALFFAILSAIANINSYDGYLPAWVGWMCLFIWSAFQIILIIGVEPEKVEWQVWGFQGSFALLAGWPIIFGDFVPWPRRTPYHDYANPDVVIWARVIGMLVWGLAGSVYYRGFLSFCLTRKTKKETMDLPPAP